MSRTYNSKDDRTIASNLGIDEDDIGTVSVKLLSELSDVWNSIGLTEDGNGVSTVIIDTHAKPSQLDLYDSMTTNQILGLQEKKSMI